VEHRTQRRTHAAVPVEIRGVDARGESFQESTQAVEVSRRGLSVLTRRDLPVYTSLTVLIPGRGPTLPNQGPTDFFSSASVVRVHKEGEMNRVSIRFVGATLATYTSETG
jgi:TFIIF-interacting CTD phosphatase-like protein